MIKIIERKTRRKFAYKFCSQCHSDLEFEIEDVELTQQYNEINYFIYCPICGTCISVFPTVDFPWED